jgi:hypothetical protein
MSVAIVDAGPKKISRSIEVAAPAHDIFEIIADPRRHCELDGSGTVKDNVSGPERLTKDAKFSTKMKQYGFPYKITSVVTDFEDDTVVEWQHPLGHRWRWEVKPLTGDTTLVTETFDFTRLSGAKAGGLKWFGSLKQNASGIESTLTKLQAKFAAS